MAGQELLLVSRDEATTRCIGAALAGALRPGDVVGLTGDLGAGKTRLVQGAAAALGVTGPVLSPTFVLMRDYAGDVPVHHVDAYRLAGPGELEDLGLDEVLDPSAVVFVEWADRVEPALPPDWAELAMTTLEDETRQLRLRLHGDGWAGRRAEVLAALEAFRRP